MILDAEPGGLIETRHEPSSMFILECVDLGSGLIQRLAIAGIVLERETVIGQRAPRRVALQAMQRAAGREGIGVVGVELDRPVQVIDGLAGFPEPLEAEHLETQRPRLSSGSSRKNALQSATASWNRSLAQYILARTKQGVPGSSGSTQERAGSASAMALSSVVVREVELRPSDERPGMPRIEADRLVQVGHGFFLILARLMAGGPPEVGVRVPRVEPDRFVDVGQGLVELVLGVVAAGPLQAGIRALRVEPDGLLEVLDGLFMLISPAGRGRAAPREANTVEFLGSRCTAVS